MLLNDIKKSLSAELSDKKQRVTTQDFVIIWTLTVMEQITHQQRRNSVKLLTHANNNPKDSMNINVNCFEIWIFIVLRKWKGKKISFFLLSPKRIFHDIRHKWWENYSVGKHFQFIYIRILYVAVYRFLFDFQIFSMSSPPKSLNDLK